MKSFDLAWQKVFPDKPNREIEKQAIIKVLGFRNSTNCPANV